MITREKWLNKWAKRRARAKTLREQDQKYWTYRRLGRKFGVTAERARQLVNGKKNRGIGQETPGSIQAGTESL